MRSYVRFLLQKEPSSYLLVCLFSGLSSGFFYPLLGIFVIDGLGASSLQMGGFFCISICSGVVVSQWIAKMSDKGWDRRKIILCSQAAFILVMILFIFIRHYYVALLIMVGISSFTAAAMPQTYTMGREYADSHLGERATFFISLMRAMMSFSWVIGPPLAFIIYGKYDFNGAFIFAALTMLFSVVIVWTQFPSRVDNGTCQQENDPAFAITSWRKIAGVPLYLGALLMLFWANSMYVMSIPLFVTKDLGLSGAVAGQLLGLAAFVEIPIMVLAGLWASNVNPQRLMVLGAASACVFYFLLFNSELLWQMYLLQLLNGVAVGITASLGIVIIQNKMSYQMGTATTLFNNSIMIASLLSSVTIGIVAEFTDYRTIILFMIMAGTLGLILLLMSARKNKDIDISNLQTDV